MPICDGSNNDDDTRGARVTERYTDEEIASMSEEEVEDVEGWTLAYDFKPAMVAMYRRFVLLPLAKVPRRSPMPRKVRYITLCYQEVLGLPCTALRLSSLLSFSAPHLHALHTPPYVSSCVCVVYSCVAPYTTVLILRLP